MQWETVAEGPGRYNYRMGGEASVDLALSLGMSVMGILDARWGNETQINKLPWASPVWEHLDRWEDFVRQTVAHYKDRVKFWEIINEPPFFWWYPVEDGVTLPDINPDIKRAPIARYAELLRASARAIRETDPEARIVMGSGFADGTFLRKLYELGCKDDFDIVSVHYLNCRHPAEFARGMKNLRGIMAEFGDAHKPIWDTENGPGGALIGVEDKVAGEGRSVYGIYRHCLAHEHGLDRYFWFNNVPHKEAGVPAGGIPLYCEDGSPGLDYQTLRTLFNRVGDSGLAASAHLEQEVHVYVFEGVDRPVSIIWATAPAKARLSGREMELTGRPVYLDGNVLETGIEATVTGKRKTAASCVKQPEPDAPVFTVPFSGEPDWNCVPYLGKDIPPSEQGEHFCLLPSSVGADVQAVWDEDALRLRIRTQDGGGAKTGFAQFTLRDNVQNIEWPYFYNGYGLFTLYASERGPKFLRYAHIRFDEYPAGVVENADVCVEPWDGGLLYTARIPWADLGPARPGTNEPFLLMFTFGRGDNLLDVPGDKPEEWTHNFEDNFIVKKPALAAWVRFEK
jgi:hypothetical protein